MKKKTGSSMTREEVQITKESNNLKNTEQTIKGVEESIPRDTLQEEMDKEFKDDNPIDETINDATEYERNRKQREAIANAQTQVSTTVYITGTADVRDYLLELKTIFERWEAGSLVNDIDNIEQAKCLIKMLKGRIKELKFKLRRHALHRICRRFHLSTWWSNLDR